MARAMRPVVMLMVLATVLFIVDGLLDHNVAGRGGFDDHKGVGWTSYLFAFANLLMTVAVARGSERTLLGRIALSAFFIVERPLTAFVLGPTPIEGHRGPPGDCHRRAHHPGRRDPRVAAGPQPRPR